LAHAIADSSSRLKNAGNNLNRFQGESDLLDAEIARKQGELAYWEEICQYQSNLHDKRVAEREAVEALVTSATGAVFSS